MPEEPTQDQTPETKPTQTDQSMRTIIIGGCIILWLTAFYMINLMNGISKQLETISTNWQSSISILSRRPLENYQIVDKDGAVIYKFQVDPKLLEDAMGEEMMEMMNRPDGSSASKE